MNDIRKKRLSQLDKKSFIVRIDISKGFRVARVFDYRGIEIGKTLEFDNDIFGYKLFELWCSDLIINLK